MGVIVELRMVVDEDVVRKEYNDYAADCAYYLARGELTPDHPDIGYRTGTPPPYAEYLAAWTLGLIEDVVGSKYSYRIERAT